MPRRTSITKEEFDLIKKSFFTLLGFDESAVNDPEYLSKKFAKDYKLIAENAASSIDAEKVMNMLNIISKGMSSPQDFIELLNNKAAIKQLGKNFNNYVVNKVSYTDRLSSDVFKNIYAILAFCDDADRVMRKEDNVFNKETIAEIERYANDKAKNSIDLKGIQHKYNEVKHLADMLKKYNEHVYINAINGGVDPATAESLIVNPYGINLNEPDEETLCNDFYDQIYIRKKGMNKLRKALDDSKDLAEKLEVSDGLDDEYYWVENDWSYYSEEYPEPQRPELLPNEEIIKNAKARKERMMKALQDKAQNLSEVIREYNERIRIIGDNEILDTKTIDSMLLKLPGVDAMEGTEDFEKQVLNYVSTHEDNSEFFKILEASQKAVKKFDGTNIDFSKGPKATFFKRSSFEEDFSNKYDLPSMPNRKHTKEAAEEERRKRAEYSEDFKNNIEKKRQEKENLDQGFDDATHEYSNKSDKDQFRFDSKKSLEGMALVYKSWFPDDEQLAPILDEMEELSLMDVTSDSGYRAEGKLMADIEKKLTAFSAALEQEERALHEEAIKYLRKADDGPTGGFVWAEQDLNDKKFYWNMSSGRVEADPDVAVKDAELKAKFDKLDQKNALVTSLGNFIQAQKDGNLVFNTKENHISVKTSDFEGTFFNTDSARFPQILHSIPTVDFDYSDRPLFPHEPCGDDVSQGGIGDCYFVSTLCDIARTHPEKIREAMHDNGNGTVTVRLFSENDEGQYEPVYVTVEKKVPSFLVTNAVADNCLWVACMEQALAASGLYNGTIQKPVPPNMVDKLNEEYERLKKLEKKGLLTEEIRQESKEKYPWLFKDIYNRKKQTTTSLILKWPSLNSIAGGFGKDASKILLGDSIKRKTLWASDMDKEERTFNASTPKSVEAMCAIILADANGGLTSKNFGIDIAKRKGLENLTGDDLFEAAFKLSGEPAKKKAEAKAEFLANKSKLTAALEKEGKTVDQLSRKEFLDIAYKAFATVSGNTTHYNYVNTFSALLAERYSEKQIDLYDKIDRCVKNNLPVGFGTGKKDQNNKIPIPGHHLFSVLGVYTNDLGMRMIKLRNPWGTRIVAQAGIKMSIDKDGNRKYEKSRPEHGEFEMEFSDWVKCVSDLDLSDVDDYLKKNPPKEKKVIDEKSKLIQGDTIDYKTMFSYVGAIDNVCKAFIKTEHWYRRSSEEYIKLRNAARDLRKELAGMNGKSIKDFSEKFNNLTEAIKNYDAYCEKKPAPDDKRRAARAIATNDLKLISEAIKLKYKSPLDYKRDCLLMQNVPNDIIKFSEQIKTSFLGNDVQKLVNCIAARNYLDNLMKTAANLPTQKLEEKLRPEVVKAEIDKMAPRIAQVLSGMDKKSIEKLLGENSLCGEVEKRAKEQFINKSDVDNAQKQYKANMKKITDSINADKPSKEKKSAKM